MNNFNLSIQHIVFDVGNVLVRWDPAGIVEQVFANDHPSATALANLTQQIFKSEIWMDLNRGKFTERDAIQLYHGTLGIDISRLEIMMQTVKASLTPIGGSFDLLHKLHQANYPLYALTDNTKEIMAYLKKKYDFWRLFKGIVVSAEFGVLKPSAEIYQHLLTSYHLIPEQTVFIDDLLQNVEGARKLKMHAIQFENAKKCFEELQQLHVK